MDIQNRSQAKKQRSRELSMDSKETPIAVLSGAYKRYGSTTALDGVDLEVPRGKLLSILGPNGAGKTTAISLMLGLQKPDAGHACLFGKSPGLIEVRRRIGVMMQDVSLVDNLRARELIDLVASYYPTPMTVKEVMEMTDTTSLSRRPYGKLSGGQKRQVQVAMALVGRPRLLFLDEPTVGLDIRARETVWILLREMICRGTSIVLTTHYMEEAEALADRVAVLVKGRLVALGSVSEVRGRVARKQVCCKTKLKVEDVQLWPGVESVRKVKQQLHIMVVDAETIVRRLLQQEDCDLQELEVSRAGLAEAFNEITREAVQ